MQIKATTEDEQDAAETLLHIDNLGGLVPISAEVHSDSVQEESLNRSGEASGRRRVVRTVILCPECNVEFHSAEAFKKHLPHHVKVISTGRTRPKDWGQV